MLDSHSHWLSLPGNSNQNCILGGICDGIPDLLTYVTLSIALYQTSLHCACSTSQPSLCLQVVSISKGYLQPFEEVFILHGLIYNLYCNDCGSVTSQSNVQISSPFLMMSILQSNVQTGHGFTLNKQIEECLFHKCCLADKIHNQDNYVQPADS